MSSYAWTLPRADGTAAAAAETEFDERIRIGCDLFWDGDFTVTASKDWGVIEGIPALRQSILRRLVTAPGEWPTRPKYGIGALDFVYETLTNTRAAELINRIRDQLSQDPRIAKVTAVAVENNDDGLLRIRISIEVAGRVVVLKPFSLPEETPQ